MSLLGSPACRSSCRDCESPWTCPVVDCRIPFAKHECPDCARERVEAFEADMFTREVRAALACVRNLGLAKSNLCESLTVDSFVRNVQRA